jgi:hypothetical protein
MMTFLQGCAGTEHCIEAQQASKQHLCAGWGPKEAKERAAQSFAGIGQILWESKKFIFILTAKGIIFIRCYGREGSIDYHCDL